MGKDETLGGTGGGDPRKCPACGWTDGDGCTCPGKLSRWREFVAELRSDEVRDALRKHLDRKPVDTAHARELLVNALLRLPTPEQRASTVSDILAGFYAKTLTDWAAKYRLAAKTGAEATTALLRRYAGAEAREEEVSREAEFDYDPTSVGEPLPRFAFQRDVVRELARLATPDAGGRWLVHVATGGGKTRIANDWVHGHALPAGTRVLWVTKDWELLRQAARDLCRRHPGMRARVGRVGGDARRLALEENPGADVVYTTLHTFAERSGTDFRGQRFGFVVVDELHWGEEGELYSRVMRRYERATFVGLTATPREWTEYRELCSYPFLDLMRREVLARPSLIESSTGERWDPKRSITGGDFDSGSVAELGRRRPRNELIVRTYRESAERFGKTIVFACDVDHAQRLTRLFLEYGIPAGVLHYGMTEDERRDVRSRFVGRPGELGGRLAVLVNVAMLTHGVDIPDVKTVFLARPTLSDTLFSQMVGRGARRIDGKDEFFVVDFVDNLDRHGRDLITAKRFFGPLEKPVVNGGGGGGAGVAPRYSYAPATIDLYPGKPGYESLRGLEFQPRQEFGIELEVTRHDFVPHVMPGDWEAVARALLAAVAEAAGSDVVAPVPFREHNAAGKNYRWWNVEWDGSCGWEISSRTLGGEAGLEEAYRVIVRLQQEASQLGLRVNHRTGVHVNLGWQPSFEEARKLVAFTAFLEPALFSLVSPSRFDNPMCAPIANVRPDVATISSDQWAGCFGDPTAKYLTVNPMRLFDRDPRVEVRLHNGSLNGEKILTWLSLWMRLVHAVEKGFSFDPRAISAARLPLDAGQDGDIARMAMLAGCGPELVAKLRARREQVVTRSWFAHPVYGPRAREAHAAWGHLRSS